MLAYIDYAFIIIFFVALLGLVLLIGSPVKAPAPAGMQDKVLLPVRENKAAYGFLIGLLVLLFILTLVMQRQQMHAGS